MSRFNSFRRRLSTRWHRGAFSAIIARNNNRSTYIFMLVLFTVVFTWLLALLTRGFLKSAFSGDKFVVLPLLAFVVLWYAGGLRIALWRSFGVEELVIEDGVMRWTRKALFWVRQLEIQTREIKDVRAVTPWHAQSNRVEFTALGKRQKIGDMLLRDEAIELCEMLRKAVGTSK